MNVKITLSTLAAQQYHWILDIYSTSFCSCHIACSVIFYRYLKVRTKYDKPAPGSTLYLFIIRYKTCLCLINHHCVSCSLLQVFTMLHIILMHFEYSGWPYTCTHICSHFSESSDHCAVQSKCQLWWSTRWWSRSDNRQGILCRQPQCSSPLVKGLSQPHPMKTT